MRDLSQGQTRGNITLITINSRTLLVTISSIILCSLLLPLSLVATRGAQAYLFIPVQS